MSLGDRAIEAVERHPAVLGVRLVGSRADGTATALSDWDFAVETDDFDAVAGALGSLLTPLRPLVQQWDRLSETWCWMVIVPGPTKLDFIFTAPHEDEPPWQPGPDNLAAVDGHFWDWVLWLTSKRAKGRGDLVSSELGKMSEHILRPMGVAARPATLDEAVSSYVAGLDRLERRFGVRIPRDLRREVVRVLHESHDRTDTNL